MSRANPREAVRQRHHRIHQLRKSNMSLWDIAEEVGLESHQSVRYHLTRCKCTAWTPPYCEHEYIRTCRKCGVLSE